MSFIFHHRAVPELIAGVLWIDGIEAVSNLSLLHTVPQNTDSFAYTVQVCTVCAILEL